VEGGAVTQPAPTTALAKRNRGGTLARVDVEKNLRRAAELAKNAYAENTRRAYESDVEDWKAFASELGVAFCPAESAAIAAYIGYLEEERELAPATIKRRCSAISKLHKDAKVDNPTADPKIRELLRALSRTHPPPRGGAEPFTMEMLAAILSDEELPLRNRALLGVALVTGMRRSELVSLIWQDVKVERRGVAILLRKSKTDQEGEGQVKALPFSRIEKVCSARTLLAWRDASPDNKAKDRVFSISGQTVYDVAKKVVEKLGFDPTRYGAHSLRAGLMTSASQRGVPLPIAMGASGHKTPEVAVRYTRISDAFNNLAHQEVVEGIAEAYEKEKQR
jgi:site-specific recombinase XerD